MSDNFNTHGPFSLSWKSAEALHELNLTLEKIKDLKEKENGIEADAEELEYEYDKNQDLIQFETEVK